MTRRRRPPESLGRFAEDFAAAELVGAGMQLLARRLRTRNGELDLVLRDGDTLVVVEVKARRVGPGRTEAPERAVDDRRFERLRAALARLAPAMAPRARWLRVDVVAVCCRPAAAPELRRFRGTPFAPPGA